MSRVGAAGSIAATVYNFQKDSTDNKSSINGDRAKEDVKSILSNASDLTKNPVLSVVLSDKNTSEAFGNNKAHEINNENHMSIFLHSNGQSDFVAAMAAQGSY